MQSMPLRSLAIMQCIQLVCTYVYIQYVFMCNCSFPASPLCVCRTDDVSSDFTLRGLSVQSIHGDRSAVDPLEHMRLCQSLCSVLFCREQYDREQALDDFKTGIYSAMQISIVWCCRCTVV